MPKRLERLEKLIHERTGLRGRNLGSEGLRNLVLSRVQALNLASIEAYEKFLERDGSSIQEEIRVLTVCLTPGETHFFRDRGQFNLLENTILPALIEARSQAKVLRIWSAGCSTGDEAYSIAIALDPLLSRKDWDVQIIGTDINPMSLEKARSGAYTGWSFRVIDEGRKSSYFQHSSGKWTLNPRLRDAVRFSSLDLIHDSFPSTKSGIHDVDLIVCRNVFIYFTSDSIRLVLDKMVQALRPGGYLLTAHGELHGQEPANLEKLTYPESSVHRKYARGLRLPQIAPSHDRRLPVAEKNSASTSSAEFEQQARACADKADYDQAEEWCKRAIACDPFAVRVYYLLSKIAEERKQSDIAKEMLKKAIYLDPEYVAAFVDLAAVYERENDSKRARKLRLSALDCLRGLEENARHARCEGTPPAELAQALEALVGCEAGQ